MPMLLCWQEAMTAQSLDLIPLFLQQMTKTQGLFPPVHYTNIWGAGPDTSALRPRFIK